MSASESGRGRSSLARLAIVLSLPAALAVYAVAFHLNIAGLDATSRAYPQAIVAFMLLLLASQAVTEFRAWLQAGDSSGFADAWYRWRRTVLTAVWTAVFVWAIGVVGFYEALVVYVAVQLLILGVLRPVKLALFTAGTVAGMYLLFDLALQVRLPPGLLVG